MTEKQAPATRKVKQPQAFPNAAAVAQALLDTAIFDDHDASEVRPVAGRGNDAHFFVDDTQWEYEIIVRRYRHSV